MNERSEIVDRPTDAKGAPLTQQELDSIAEELFHLTQNERMPKRVSDKLRAIALRLQPGHAQAGLVKFADGTHGCHVCGVRAAGNGTVSHDRSFPHD
jgi:hypothetical protein